MSLFGQLFGATISQEATLDTSTLQPLTVEFLELAVELIDNFVERENAVWVQIGDAIPDEQEPWKTVRGPTTEHAVKIVFLQDTLEDRQLLRYLKGKEANTGNVNGIMYPYGFVPTLKDIVKWDGRELAVSAIDPIAPIDKPIIYMVEFAL